MHGATFKTENLRLSDCHDVLGAFRVESAWSSELAGEVGTVCEEGGIVESGFAIRGGGEHHHMGVDRGGKDWKDSRNHHAD